MRITNSMLVSNYLSDLSGNLGRITKLQGQMSSGRKFASISDDPVSLLYSLQARNKISRLEQYQRNVDTAGSWLNQGEAVVLEFNELLQSAYEATISAASDGKTAKDRNNIAEYIKQLRDQLITAANTTLGDKFMFGSYNITGSEQIAGGTQAPFTVDPVSGSILFNGLDMNDITDPLNFADLQAQKGQVMEFWVGTGIKLHVGVSGVELMGLGEHNAYTIMDDLYKALSAPDSTSDDITPFISRLLDKQSDNLALAAEFGGRTNRLELLSARYELDGITYTKMKSDAEDVDLAEAGMNYSMAEMVYNAALKAGSMIIQRSLLDFL